MSENESHFNVKIGSEKNFGLVFSVVFFLVSLYPLLLGGTIRWWALVISGVFVVLATLFPRALDRPNRVWFKFGVLLGAFIGPLVMLVVYLTTVVPTGLVIRLLGKDLLRLELDESATSYWIERDYPMGSMKDQF